MQQRSPSCLTQSESRAWRRPAGGPGSRRLPSCRLIAGHCTKVDRKNMPVIYAYISVSILLYCTVQWCNKILRKFLFDFLHSAPKIYLNLRTCHWWSRWKTLKKAANICNFEIKTNRRQIKLDCFLAVGNVYCFSSFRIKKSFRFR